MPILVGAVIHSAKLAPGHRNAFSPSLTLGWKLSNESFLENSPVVDELMLSVSGSILNTDLGIDNYYMYDGYYNQSDGAWWDGARVYPYTLLTPNKGRMKT